MRALGIDLSKYDKVFNPEQAQIKPDFVIQRVGYGLVRDEAFDVIFQGVSKFDVRLGYHYINSGIDYKAQADKYIQYSSGCDFKAHVSDFEGYANTLSVDFAYECWKWIDYVRQKTGLPVILYTGRYLYQDFILPSQKKYGIDWDSVPLWIAQYSGTDPQTSNPSLPAGRTGGWKLWQFSSTGDGTLFGTGRTDKIDQNVFNGSVNDMRQWLGVVPLPQQDENGGSMIYTGIILVDDLRVRSGPGTNFSILQKINTGASVIADKVQAGWWHLISINGIPTATESWSFCGIQTSESGQYIKLISVTSGDGSGIPDYVVGYMQDGTQVARWNLVK